MLFGATRTPFMLCYSLTLSQKYDSDVSKDIGKNLYVDNIVSSEEDAIHYFKEAKAMMLETILI